MIYFIRHGQTDWNALSKCQGRKDIPLNENGIRQAKLIYKILKEVKVDAYFCSPLLRTRQTFKYAFRREPKQSELDERLIERDFGEFEGFKRSEFDFAGFWNSNPSQTFVKAESLYDVEKRAKDFLDEINRKYKGKNIVVVSHGGFGIVLKALIDGKPENGDYLQVEMPHGEILLLDNDKNIKEKEI